VPESLEAYTEVREIRDRLDAIEHTQELLVRAEAKAILAVVWEEMDKDETMARVYLAIDGKRTQNECQ